MHGTLVAVPWSVTKSKEKKEAAVPARTCDGCPCKDSIQLQLQRLDTAATATSCERQQQTRQRFAPRRMSAELLDATIDSDATKTQHDQKRLISRMSMINKGSRGDRVPQKERTLPVRPAVVTPQSHTWYPHGDRVPQKAGPLPVALPWSPRSLTPGTTRGPGAAERGDSASRPAVATPQSHTGYPPEDRVPQKAGPLPVALPRL